MKSIRFSRRALRRAALLTLLLPAAVFLLTWVRPLVALPSAFALAAAFFLYMRSGQRDRARDVFGHEDDTFDCPVSLLVCVVLCALGWTFFSGIGGLFYQTEDHYGRNAIFRDMLEHAWPVYFEGTPYALTYYIACWILPALAGKAVAFLGADAAWSAANAALFVQTVWFLSLTLVMFLSLLRVRGLVRNAAALLLFVLFSGMDALAIPIFPDWWNSQLEWWAQGYQFSSNTTCLFWVYNQALPAWLCLMLLLSNPGDVGSYALIGLAAFPFSPMPFIGLMVYFAGLAVFKYARLIRSAGALNSAKSLLAACLTARNLLACVSLAPCFILYFMANDASGSAPLRFDIYVGSYGAAQAVIRLALFMLVEFGAYALLIQKRFIKNPVFLLTLLSLVLAPMFRIGYGQDFSMRASIPGLMALCLFCARYLLAEENIRRAPALILAALLAIGSVTPLMEFARGAYKVRQAGTLFLAADPFKTVLHPDADTHNFICADTGDALFYRYLAKPAK